MVAVVDRLAVVGSPYECRINFYHINILNKNIDIYFNIKAVIQSKYTISESSESSFLLISIGES